MVDCIKTPFGNVENPGEDVENLCKHFIIVSKILAQAWLAHMVVYFSYIKELMGSSSVSSRMRFVF
jgi:hypothetical protein